MLDASVLGAGHMQLSHVLAGVVALVGLRETEGRLAVSTFSVLDVENEEF
jgi:hypothetical protein